MQVRQVMTNDVVTIGPDESLKEAARLLIERRISGLPVVDDDGVLVGMVTEGDILHQESIRHPATTLVSFFKSAEEPASSVADVMTKKVRTIWPEADHTEAARLMESSGVKRLPVTIGGRVVGILSRADVLKVFARGDADILDEIRADVIERVLWLDKNEIEATVDGGKVTFAGTVPTRSDLRILEEMSRRTDGVISVEAGSVRYEVDDTKRSDAPISGGLPRSNW